MDKKELGPILAKAYVAVRQNVEMTLEAVMSVQAMILALQECVPEFQESYARHYQELMTGEPGRNNVEAIRQFDQVVVQIRDGNL